MVSCTQWVEPGPLQPTPITGSWKFLVTLPHWARTLTTRDGVGTHTRGVPALDPLNEILGYIWNRSIQMLIEEGVGDQRWEQLSLLAGSVRGVFIEKVTFAEKAWLLWEFLEGNDLVIWVCQGLVHCQEQSGCLIFVRWTIWPLKYFNYLSFNFCNWFKGKVI